MIGDLVRSTLAGTALLSALAASCGFDVKGLPDVRVELREPQQSTCVRGAIEGLGRTEAQLTFDTTTTVARFPGDGFEMSVTYAMHLGSGSAMQLIVPAGADRNKLAQTVPYFCPLLGHEIGHLVVARSLVSGVHGIERARGDTLAATREGLQAKTDGIYRETVARVRRDEEAYDTLTEHGVAQHRAAVMHGGISTTDIPACRV